MGHKIIAPLSCRSCKRRRGTQRRIKVSVVRPVGFPQPIRFVPPFTRPRQTPNLIHRRFRLRSVHPVHATCPSSCQSPMALTARLTQNKQNAKGLGLEWNEHGMNAKSEYECYSPCRLGSEFRDPAVSVRRESYTRPYLARLHAMRLLWC